MHQDGANQPPDADNALLIQMELRGLFCRACSGVNRANLQRAAPAQPCV